MGKIVELALRLWIVADREHKARAEPGTGFDDGREVSGIDLWQEPDRLDVEN